MELMNCIYRFINGDDEIIYIGKAKNLKNRLQAHNHLPKECYEECKKIEYTLFGTEDDMDLAERYYIPKVKPKYNDMMKDRSVTLLMDAFNNVTWHVFNNDRTLGVEQRMKKSSTFNLEQDIYEEIESYRVTYNLSSRNIALERMLLERRELIDIKEILLNKRDILQQNAVAKESEHKLKEKSNSILDNSLKNSFDNMPD